MATVSTHRPHRPAPFKPSFLSFTTGPISPALPLTPPASRPCSPPPSVLPAVTASKEKAPARPLPWLWTCHQCGTTYPLAATRRCLQDGHLFCSGSTYNSRTGRTKRHRSCSSEFDYVGWSQMAEWRLATASTAPVAHKKNCWKNCNYPSECRWGASALSAEADDTTPISSTCEEQSQIDYFSATTKDTIVEQVVAAVQESRRQDQLLQKHPATLSSIAEEESSPPTSPLKQHYALPGFDFPSPPSTSTQLSKSRSSPSLSSLAPPCPPTTQHWGNHSSSSFFDEDDEDDAFESDSDIELDSDDNTESETSSPSTSPSNSPSKSVSVSKSTCPSLSSSSLSSSLSSSTGVLAAASLPIFGIFTDHVTGDVDMDDCCSFDFASAKRVVVGGGDGFEDVEMGG